MLGLKCEICGHREKLNLKYHLESIHNLTTKEYKKLYPKSKTMTGHSKRTVEYWVYRGYSEKEAHLNVKEFQGSSKNIYIEKLLDQGKSQQEAQQLWNKKQAENSPRSLQYYIRKGYGKKEAIRMRSSVQSDFSALSSKFQGHKHSEVSKKRISKKLKKMAQDVGVENMVKRFRNKGKNGVRSDIEIKCYNELQGIFPKLEANVQLGKYIVDMKLNDTIIEFYGDFWHRNPSIYSEEVNLYGKTSKEIWDYDKKRIDYLKGLGYLVFIIWESEWDKSKEKVIQKINKLHENKN